MGVGENYERDIVVIDISVAFAWLIASFCFQVSFFLEVARVLLNIWMWRKFALI